MIDRRYQRKPAANHPWASWKPGYLSKSDKYLQRMPKKCAHQWARNENNQLFCELCGWIDL